MCLRFVLIAWKGGKELLELEGNCVKMCKKVCRFLKWIAQMKGVVGMG